MSDPIPEADAGGAGYLDRATARRLIAGSVSANPAVRELMGRIAEDHGGVARLLRLVLTDPDRLTALGNAGLLDGAPRVALDQFAELTAEALGVPYAAVSILAEDRQIRLGCNDPAAGDDRSIPLEDSICKYAVASGQPLIVDDIVRHPMLADHPMALSGTIRAYAAFPLHDPSGNPAGTLCAWDDQPRRWTGGQVQILEDLSAAAHAKVFGT
ncbi:GAF domain-containing protein [Mycolicibacterium sp. P1-18]|uniref:GAF domain-containing protein n=1 Tax=Mycolicibacterium sp. P1-18 TaxID=2024615 RepID=UPI0011F268CE|nr:GAF domain-containing protein [Mycolicibacterium sp. P1-18]KAA0096691.1 GAF domain-containing protein [Mycolicibacterium sp. P1-18]